MTSLRRQGKSGAEGWAEVWDVIGPVRLPHSHSRCRSWTDSNLRLQLASQVMLGKTMFFQDQTYCIYRNGMLEETCEFECAESSTETHRLTMRRIRHDLGIRHSPGRARTHHGLHGTILKRRYCSVPLLTDRLRSTPQNPSFETTARVIAERRLGTLRELSQLTQLSRASKGTSADLFSPRKRSPLTRSSCQTSARKHCAPSRVTLSTFHLPSSTPAKLSVSHRLAAPKAACRRILLLCRHAHGRVKTPARRDLPATLQRRTPLPRRASA